MIEHSVYDYFHASLVHLFHKIGKKPVAGLQILLIGGAEAIFVRLIIGGRSFFHTLAAVFYDAPKMGINVIIILCIILMIRRGYKKRIEIKHLDTQILKIIQLVPYSLKITAVKAAHIHSGRVLLPVLYLIYRPPDIHVL